MFKNFSGLFFWFSVMKPRSIYLHIVLLKHNVVESNALELKGHCIWPMNFIELGGVGLHDFDLFLGCFVLELHDIVDTSIDYTLLYIEAHSEAIVNEFKF